MADCETIIVSCEADAFWCRHRCFALAKALKFEAKAQWAVAIAVAELTSNVLKHAGRGQVTIRVLAVPCRGIELLVEDNGPGIENVSDALRDGCSGDPKSAPGGPWPRKGMGCGLGAVVRLMDEVRIDSAPGRGTRVVARKWMNTSRPTKG